MSTATVIVDASFCSRTKAAGWAAWIAHEGAKIKKSGQFKERPVNSTTAELLAALCGIWFAYQSGARDILVQSDCTAVIGAVQGRGGHAKQYRDAKLAHFPDASVRAKHVRGHTKTDDARSYCNRWCDSQAKIEMRKQRDGSS